MGYYTEAWRVVRKVVSEVLIFSALSISKVVEKRYILGTELVMWPYLVEVSCKGGIGSLLGRGERQGRNREWMSRSVRWEKRDVRRK